MNLIGYTHRHLYNMRTIIDDCLYVHADNINGVNRLTEATNFGQSLVVSRTNNLYRNSINLWHNKIMKNIPIKVLP